MSLLLATLGVSVALMLLVFVWRRSTNARIRSAFESLCRRFELMGHFGKRVGPHLHPVAMGTHRGRLTRVESALAHIGSTPRPVTRFSVTRSAADPMELALRRLPHGRREGERYVSCGITALDQKLVLKTNDEERAREILDDSVSRGLLGCVTLGMSPPGIEVAGDAVSYVHEDLLVGERRRRLAEAMIVVMQDLADRLDASRPVSD